MTNKNAKLIINLRKLTEFISYFEPELQKTSKNYIPIALTKNIETMNPKELRERYNHCKDIMVKFIIGEEYINWYISVIKIKSQTLHIYYGMAKHPNNRRRKLSYKNHAHYIVTLESNVILYRPLDAPHFPQFFIYKEASSS